MPSDRELACRDCGSSFVFTAGEQEFYSTKGLTHDPVRCPSCRANRKAMRPEDRFEAPSYGTYVSWGGRTPRQLNVATCAECHQMTEVPFLPRGDRPVYCSSCYNAVRERQEADEQATTVRLASQMAGGGVQSERPEGEGPATVVATPGERETPGEGEAPAEEASGEAPGIFAL